MAHRGPDAAGLWHDPLIPGWLGHRRLSIVDLSERGHQPLTNEDDTIRLVCNGEIYNYPNLRTRLEGLGHKFSSDSDSEAIIHAYETWGPEALENLEGMFAFALWDSVRQRLFAARDRVGIKPLYFHRNGSELVLASEAGGILGLLEKRPDPDPTGLAYSMTLGYIPAPWSIWSGIKKLEAGHYLTWTPGEAAGIRRYWEPPVQLGAAQETDPEWPRLFEEVLREHLLADVPLGLFLSGGLDSTSVAVGLSELGRPLEALTVAYPGSAQDESPVARRAAREVGLDHRVLELEIDSIPDLITEVAAAYDEPQGYSALLSMFLISREAAKDYKVVLAGDGGDEVLGGYNWYRDLEFSPPRRSWIRRPTGRRRVRSRDGAEKRARAAARFSEGSPLHRHAWRLYPRFLPEEAEHLLAPLGLNFDDELMLAPLRKHYRAELPLKRALQRVDLMTFCSDSILAKVDRASMTHSLEVRVPFLDRRIVEWGLSRPVENDEEVYSKPVLRRYLAPSVSKDVLDHPKQGFSLPALTGFDWNAALETIREGAWVRQGYWDRTWPRLLEQGVPYREARIWNLLMLTAWSNAWL